MKLYQNIVQHYEDCLKRHGDTHLGVDWPNEPDALKRYAIMLDVIRNPEKDSCTLLDFGCGTSHLYGYLKSTTQEGILYSGLDISPDFIEVAHSKYPEINYLCLDVLESPDALPSFDYIVCNGVFTEKRTMSFDAMWSYTQAMLRAIFEKATVGIAFNVMSKAVDWERDDLFHLPTDLLIAFMTQELSRHFIIRNDYGLYEYTVYLYKKSL